LPNEQLSHHHRVKEGERIKKLILEEIEIAPISVLRAQYRQIIPKLRKKIEIKERTRHN